MNDVAQCRADANQSMHKIPIRPDSFTSLSINYRPHFLNSLTSYKYYKREFMNPLKSPGVCVYEVGLGPLCTKIQDLQPAKGESTFIPIDEKCFFTSNDLQLYVDSGMFCSLEYMDYFPIYKYPVPNTAPVIIILGDNPTEIYQYSEYTDSGATALDQEDGDLTSNIVTINQVDTAVTGTYTVKYAVQDSNDLISIIIRTVQVVSD